MARESRRSSSRGSDKKGSSSSKGSNKKTSGYVTLFEVKKNDDGEEYFQFVKNPDYVDIRVNGVSINGKCFYINDPSEKFEIMLENGDITEDEADAKIAKIPDYVLEEGTIKLG
jgi:hypothetical protein